MKAKRFISSVFAMGVLAFASIAQVSVLSDFENGMTDGTRFEDTWERSPFNTGRCSYSPEVIQNPHQDSFNESQNVLHYVRPYYGGDRAGVIIKLERPFTITSTTQYVHLMVHKPVSSRMILIGISQGDDVRQFTSVSSSESRAGTWSDAVFAAKGNNDVIDRIVVYADAETPVNRLMSDIDIYIDDIVLMASSDPRTVTNYCRVGGTADPNRYISSVSTVGASLNLISDFEKTSEVHQRVGKGSVIVEAGSPFTVTLTQRSTSTSNTPWVCDLYLDINGDKEFVSNGEYLGRITGTTYGTQVNYTTEVTVPTGTGISSLMLRAKFTDASDYSAPSSCDNVKNGAVIDLPIELVKYSEKPIISIGGFDDQSGLGAVRFKSFEGTEVKVANGKIVTVIATPADGCRFVGWYNDVTRGLVSTDAEFSFSATFDIRLLAKFAEIPYCKPVNSGTVGYWNKKISIVPASSSALYYRGSASTDVATAPEAYQQLSIMGGVNVKRQTTFQLFFTPSATGVYNSIWADWNNDHEFTADEFVMSTTNSSVSLTVPATAQNGNVAIRVITSNSAMAADAACGEIGSASTTDLMVTVAPNDSERFTLTAVPSIAGAATFTVSPAPGPDGKYAAGTNVEITCVPASGYDFVQWMKDGMAYGATMTSNNPLPVTALNTDLELTMKVVKRFPEYCEGTAPNNSDGNHYGIGSGKVSVNGLEAFSFTNTESLNDLSASCIANVCPGDVINIEVAGMAEHIKWSDGYVYLDWNMDGVWSSDESYEMFHNGNQTSYTYNVTVPETVGDGCFGMRLNCGESSQYNSYGGDSCKARRRGTLLTFRINSTGLPAGDPIYNVTKGEGTTVTLTDTKGKVINNKELLEPGKSYVLTVFVNSNYVLSGVTLNGTPITMEETGVNSYLYQFVATESGATIVVSSHERQYCQPDWTETRTSRTDGSNDNRYLTAFRVTGARHEGVSNSLNFTSFSSARQRPVYEDHSNVVLHCTNGDVLIPTISYTGSWMHRYVYVDWGRDFSFDTGDASNRQDLVAWTYIEGRNNANQTASNDGSASLGSFTVPQDAAGTYRMRIKVDWDNLDACGNDSEDNHIAHNGGGIADFTLHVHNASSGLESATAENNTVIEGAEGGVVIYSPGDNMADVFIMTSGRLVKEVKFSEYASIDLAPGYYVVKVVSTRGVTIKKVYVV